MPFRFERFVAFRYLRGARGRGGEAGGFLRFIIYVSIGGVAVGVAALLLALSIVRGFSSRIEEKIVGFGAHVQVQSYFDAPLQEAGRLRERLGRLEHVTRVTPAVIGFVLLRHSRNEIDGVALWGAEQPPRYLRDRIVEGAFDFAPDAAGRAGIVVGESLARRMGLDPGEVVTTFAMTGREENQSQGMGTPRVEQFHVTGVYETSLSDFDDRYVFTDLGVARRLMAFGPQEVTRLDLTLERVELADTVAASVQEHVDYPVQAVTIYQAFSGLFAWVNLQESITPLVIGVIILVAAFNIIGALLMMMVEKTREVGVLSSLGASAQAVRRLFMSLGLMIGSLGTALGAGLALTLGLLQERYELIPLPAEAYYMSTAPVELHALDFVIVAAVAMLLCAVASYVPARVAARIDPVRAIRFR